MTEFKNTEELAQAFGEFHSHYTGRLDALEMRMNRPGFGSSGNGESAALVEQKAMLANFMRTGANEHKSSSGMTIGSDPSGGYTVTDEMSSAMTQTIFETSAVRQAGARVINITSNAWEELVDKDDVTANWVDEVTARAATTTPDLAKLRIPAHEMSAEPRATQQLIEDSDQDIVAWLTGKVGDKFGRMENAAFLVGTGVAQPRGLTTYPTAATSDATRAWGTFEHVATGVSGDFAASNPGDILFDAVNAMKPSYRPGAVWLMPRAVATKIRKFKENTTNAYIWQPGLQAGQPPNLLGYSVFEMEDMPALAGNSLSIAFVNMKRAYYIVDRLAVSVLRDPYTARPNVVFATRRRVGGDVGNFEACKFVKFA